MKPRLLPQKAILACLLALMLLAPMAEAQAQGYVRQDFATLTIAQINALRNGIAEMKRRSMSDPTSWLYQANIHGTNDRPLRTAWNTCQHGSYLFLSWHRMYLYYFERILRRASGDPNFALPYWNYNSPTQRALPLPFRSPADASNPLYVSGRRINNGSQLRESTVSFSRAFSSTNFSSPQGSSLSFGGQRVPGPQHIGSPHGQFESQPHDIIHVSVGGWMGQVNLAARDPIFWLHHANIDRLWKRWLDLGGGRSNPPTSDTVWMNTTFTFFDENGQSVPLTGAQILNTVTQLNYRYDDDPAAALPAREMMATSIETGVELDPTRYVRFSVPIKEEVQPKIARFTAVEGVAGTLVLNIEGIEYDEDPGVYYEIYINLPEGEKAPDPQSPHFVGTLATFALEQGGKYMLAITEAARALKDLGRWTEENISVTFVPRGPLPPPGEAVAPIPEAAQVAPTKKVKIGRISVSME